MRFAKPALIIGGAILVVWAGKAVAQTVRTVRARPVQTFNGPVGIRDFGFFVELIGGMADANGNVLVSNEEARRLKDLKPMMESQVGSLEGYLLELNIYDRPEGPAEPTSDLIDAIGTGKSPVTALAASLGRDQVRRGKPSYVLRNEHKSGFIWLARNANGEWTTTQRITGAKAERLRTEAKELDRQWREASRQFSQQQERRIRRESSDGSGGFDDHESETRRAERAEPKAPSSEPKAPKESRVGFGDDEMKVEMRPKN